jgi:hypothetical protein
MARKNPTYLGGGTIIRAHVTQGVVEHYRQEQQSAEREHEKLKEIERLRWQKKFAHSGLGGPSTGSCRGPSARSASGERLGDDTISSTFEGGLP